MSNAAAPESTPPPVAGGNGSTPPGKPGFEETKRQRNEFLVMALNMSWQLAIVVLVPIIGGVELDKALGTKDAWTFAGLGVALIGSALVMWRAMQTANRLPVPKLTDAQKRAIQKQYEEDDDE